MGQAFGREVGWVVLRLDPQPQSQAPFGRGRPTRCAERLSQHSKVERSMNVRPCGANQEAMEPSGCAAAGINVSSSRRLRTLSWSRQLIRFCQIFRV